MAGLTAVQSESRNIEKSLSCAQETKHDGEKKGNGQHPFLYPHPSQWHGIIIYQDVTFVI